MSPSGSARSRDDVSPLRRAGFSIDPVGTASPRLAAWQFHTAMLENQPGGLTTVSPVLWLESEHVVASAVGKGTMGRWGWSQGARLQIPVAVAGGPPTRRARLIAAPDTWRPAP